MAGRARLTPSKMARIAGRIIEETLPKLDFSLAVTKQEYRARWKKVQKRVAEKKYAVGFACGSELDRSDIAWLAAVFDPIIERYGILIPAEGTPVILAGSEGGHVIEEAAENSGANVALLREFQISDEDYRHARFKSIAQVLRSLKLRGRKRKVAVFSSPEFLPTAHYELLCGAFGKKNVVFDEALLQQIKYVKSRKELRICEQANIVADAAFRAVLACVQPGVTEIQVAGVADFVMKQLGAHRTGFPTIVTAGTKRGFSVIGPATTNRIRRGDMVSLGLSPTWNGYHGIIRRTVRCGVNPTRGQRSLIKAVEGLYTTVMDATKVAAARRLPSNSIDQAGKAYLKNLRLKTVKGKMVVPKEPYTFVHNTGCSECQEGMGAVTPYTEYPLGRRVALMIDVALMGFERGGELIFEAPYAVVEDAFWKDGKKVGVYNRFPLNVQHLVGNTSRLGKNLNPYHQPLE